MTAIISAYIFPDLTSQDTDVPVGAVTEAARFENEGTLSVRTGKDFSTKNWIPKNDNPSSYCPDGVECRKLGASCILCDFNYWCTFGKEYNTTCKAKTGINCSVRCKKLAFFVNLYNKVYKNMVRKCVG